MKLDLSPANLAHKMDHLFQWIGIFQFCESSFFASWAEFSKKEIEIDYFAEISIPNTHIFSPF